MQNNSIILTTKLHPPTVCSDHIHRARLLDKLEKDYKSKPLSLVCAPAGYGKSYLVGRWLSERGIKTCWISFNEEDNSLQAFLAYLIASIKNTFHESLSEIEKLSTVANPPPLEILVTVLINEIEQIEENFVLVFDDYHRINKSTIHNFIIDFLKYPPSNLHLCIISRKDPPLKLNSFRVYNQMNEVRMSDLAFNKKEIFLLYKNMKKIDLDETILSNLYEKTEGWITGLRLTAYSIETLDDLIQMVGRIKEKSGLVYNFLVEEVLEKQQPELREFLLSTSILDRFCPDLINALFDNENNAGEVTGQVFIDRIKRANLFLISLDHEGNWYRYHHEFQDLLRRQLASKKQKAEIDSLHRRASKWFAENNFIVEALEHSIEANDVEGAAKIIEQNREMAVNSDRLDILSKWLEYIPEEVIQKNPHLLTARAWIFLLYNSQIVMLIQTLDTIDSLMTEDFSLDSMRGEVALLRGYILLLMGDAENSLKFLEIANKFVPITSDYLRAQIELVFSLATQMTGKKDEAITSLDSIIKNFKFDSEISFSRLLVSYVYIYCISCESDKAKKANKRLRELTSGGHVYVETWTNHLQGIIHLICNELDEAVDYLNISVKNRFLHYQRGVVDLMAALMLAYQLKGLPKKAYDILKQLKEFKSSISDPIIQLLTESAEVRLAILQNNSEVVHRWIGLTTLPEFEPAMLWWIEVPSVTYCRALIYEGSENSLIEAEKKLNGLIKLNEVHHNIYHIIDLLILKAILKMKQASEQEALLSLNRSIDLASEGNILFPFLEQADELLDLLKQVSPTKRNRKFLSNLINIIENRNLDDLTTKETKSFELNSKIESAEPLLSQREFEVLKLVSIGLRNNEIAEKLYVSIDTIKKHIYHICKKLGVNSRVAAIHQAKKLKLL